MSDPQEAMRLRGLRYVWCSVAYLGRRSRRVLITDTSRSRCGNEFRAARQLVPHEPAHPGAFRELLGIRIDEFTSVEVGPGSAPRRGTGTATDWQAVIEVDGAEQLATYPDGELKGWPAATRHRYEAGTATYLGTSSDRQTMSRLILDCATAAGVTTVLHTPDGVEVVRR